MTYDKALSCYSFTLTLSDGYNEVIFYRMNGSNTDNKLDNKWNQTPGNNSGYESLPTDGKNCYKLTTVGITAVVLGQQSKIKVKSTEVKP